jgi:hypothetical protein
MMFVRVLREDALPIETVVDRRIAWMIIDRRRKVAEHSHRAFDAEVSGRRYI